jgi:hypothetical protein
MIDGFRIDVTADEMGRHIDSRIEYHRGRAQECEGKLTRLRALESSHDEEEDVFEMCGSSRVHGLERMAMRHRAREMFLIFARNHIVANELYRLTDGDLQLLEWLPLEESGVMMGRL